MSDTPELDNLRKIDENGDNNTIGAFLEWTTSVGGCRRTGRLRGPALKD